MSWSCSWYTSICFMRWWTKVWSKRYWWTCYETRHSHYSRQPIEACHRYARGKEYAKVRDCISTSIASFIKFDEKPNWDKLNLYDVELCPCDRGNIGKQKKAAANERRRQFYKTTDGIATRERYREKARIKNMILNQLTQFNVTKKAELTLETIANLVKQLQ